jgi:hypothetical protein
VRAGFISTCSEDGLEFSLQVAHVVDLLSSLPRTRSVFGVRVEASSGQLPSSQA